MDRLDFSSLEPRRLRGELIELYKIMKDMDKANAQPFSPRVEDSKIKGLSLR